MRLSTRLRSSSALWALPFVAALALFYYTAVSYDAVDRSYGYPPTLVAYPLAAMYPFTYAVASALGAWESGRLVKGAVWHLAPARSRYRVAADALSPVIGLAWLMFLVPVLAALVQGGALPTPESLRPLTVALLLCAAHAVIGFAVGRHVRPVIAAPLLAVVVFLLTATSASFDTFWWRHVLGRYPQTLGFGEVATYTSLLAQLLPTAGVAAAVALLWSPLRSAVLRAALGAAVAVTCATSAYAITKDWGPVPPLSAGDVPMRCAGSAPRVCMPEATAGTLPTVRAQAVDALADLRDAGVVQPPSVIVDTLPDGRYPRRSAARTWRVALTRAEHRGLVRYQMVRAAVRFPCARPDPFASRLSLMWAAERAGEGKVLDRLLAEDPFYSVKQRTALHDTVTDVLAKSPDEQTRWYRHSLKSACRSGA